MKRKWRKRRMMTPRRKAKRLSRVTWGWFSSQLADLLVEAWSCVPYAHHELRVMGFDEAIRHPHYSDPS